MSHRYLEILEFTHFFDLDVLLLHRPDALVEPEEVADAFHVLEKSGKVRNLSKCVIKTYVNPVNANCSAPAVKKACGKTCGECGKVWVFNRYFAGLEIFPK